MKKDQYLSIALFFAFSLLGVYLLHDSLRDSSPYAEGSLIVGGLLCAMALASIAWAVRQHLMHKALRRHLRRHS